ncbi:ABC transporter permease subunit [Rathayibacter soli]|uniref:ABC transporter permease subunit n=1 Tax=Rathayibacter soli TaxID=3144168 RepID=UPI0027E55DFC|nr:ABC transporter permease subunit [Glaciibacter superstes]
MSAFFAGLKAEFAKVLTTRMWWILAIVLFAYIALISGGLGALFGAISTGKITPRGGGGGGLPHFGALAPLIYSFATSVGYVFPVLLGALATTGEFRHQTLTPTFLTNPRREQVLEAKSLSSLVVGVAYGVVALLASVGAGSAALSIFGIDTALGDSNTWALFGRALIAMALWAAIGVGLGTLIPNQTAAIVIILAFTQFVEPLLRLAASFSDVTASIGKFLPGASSDALVGFSFFTIQTPDAQSLDWWQGGLVLLGYALILTVIGYYTTWRKDVT